jgi:antitoxin YefM
MIATNYMNAKSGFEKYCDLAVRDLETIIVTRDQDENIVIMSESSYNNLMENLHVRSNKLNYERLVESVEQLRRGEGALHDPKTDA